MQQNNQSFIGSSKNNNDLITIKNDVSECSEDQNSPQNSPPKRERKRRVGFYANPDKDGSDKKVIGEVRQDIVLERALGIQVKDNEKDKQERYEEENRLKSKYQKFANNPEVKQMILEQFASISQMKEWQITESVILTKQQIMDFLLKIECSSQKLAENIAEYVVRVIPTKLSFKGFHKFLTEGVISTNPYVQKQIAYSIYTNCKEKLYLSEVYKYYDDPLWKFILSDLLLIYKKLQDKVNAANRDNGAFNSMFGIGRVRTRSEIQRELLAKISSRVKGSKKRSTNPFLMIESPIGETLNQFREMLAINEEEAKAVTGQKDPYLTFEEFNEIEFSERGVPILIFYVIYALCGEDISDYYAESISIKSFKYLKLKRNDGGIEYLLERRETNHSENWIKRQNKELIKKAQKYKPQAKENLVKGAIKLFQDIKNGVNLDKDIEISLSLSGIIKENFIQNSVFLQTYDIIEKRK